MEKDRLRRRCTRDVGQGRQASGEQGFRFRNKSGINIVIMYWNIKYRVRESLKDTERASELFFPTEFSRTNRPRRPRRRNGTTRAVDCLHLRAFQSVFAWTVARNFAGISFLFRSTRNYKQTRGLYVVVFFLFLFYSYAMKYAMSDENI